MPKRKFRNIVLNYSEKSHGKPKFALLMLHGYGASSKVWKHQLDEFPKLGGATIAPDLRGWGDSQKPRDPKQYRLQNYVSDVENLVEELKLRKIVLAGSSMGGMIAQEFCLDNPNKVSALVLVGTRAKTRTDMPEQIQEVKEEWKNLLRETVRKSFAQNVKKSLMNSALKEGQETTRACALGSLLGFRNIDFENRLREIKIPALIVFGDEDQITPTSEGKNLSEKIPRSEFEIIKGAGHLAMLEKPREFNEILRRFLRVHEILSG